MRSARTRVCELAGCDPERMYLTDSVHSPDLAGAVDALRIEQGIESSYELAPVWIQEAPVRCLEHIGGREVALSSDPRILDGAAA